MIGIDHPCKVIPLVNGLNRPNRVGVPAAPAGIPLYYLWHEPTGLYYYECYVNQAYAIKKASETTGPRGHSDIAQAWRSEPKYCQHSWKKEDN